jgi:hypothetical protein
MPTADAAAVEHVLVIYTRPKIADFDIGSE